METSAPKRRRTSPRTAVPIQPELKSTTPENEPPRPSASPSRPSFASPTRASLERFNPEILRRRESQPRRLRSSPDAQPSAPRAATPDSTASLARALRTRLELRSTTKDAGALAASEEGSILRLSPRRPAPAHASTRPTPRPLPPPGPEDDEILNPFAGRGLRRSGLGVLPEVVVPEPELPPTPEHPDPVVSTPPSGIHNTPSKRPRRNKALAENIKSSSPLKQPPLRSPEKAQKGAPPSFNLPAKKTQTVAPPVPTTAELRGLKPVDPDADKKKLRDSLLAEISQLERDLDVASKENERIRQARLSKRDPSPPPNKHELLDLLRRHLLPAEESKPDPDPASDWLASALNPIAFLPFGKPGQPLPTLIPPSSSSKEPDADRPIPSHHPLPMTASEALPYLRLFTPLTFTSSVSPLPRQQPSSTTTTTTPSSSSSDNSDNSGPLLQQHTITATSSPPGLFSARVDMTVDTRTLRVASLSLAALDPAAAAAGELAAFAEKYVTRRGDAAGSGPHNNVSVLCWAMAEWLRAALRRARAWAVLDREVGVEAGNGKEGEGEEAVRRLAARWRGRGRKGRLGDGRGSRGRRRRGAGGVDHDEEEEDDDDEERDEGDIDGEGTRYEAGDLLPYMGRTSMDLDIPALDGGKDRSALRVQWRILFDWTGEARSEVGVLVGVPGKWHKCDDRGWLSGIPKLFDELISAGEDPLDAVRTVVCLLAGERGV